MRKELYDKLDFEERVCYRLEDNSNQIPLPRINFFILGIVIYIISCLKEMPNINIIGFCVFATLLVYLLELLVFAIQENKLNKEWTAHVLEKIKNDS